MPHFCKLVFLVLATFATVKSARADDAVDWSGKVYRGKLLVKGETWSFLNEQGKMIPLRELSHIRFNKQSTVLSKAPLTRVLHLSADEQVSGLLQRLDGKKVAFVTAWGQTISLDRTQIRGIGQVAGSLVAWHEDFDTSLNAWQIEGKPKLDPARAFFGKSSLLLTAAGQRAERAWKTPLREATIRFFLHDSGPASGMRCTIALLSKPPRIQPPTVVVEAGAYTCINMQRTFGPVAATTGWHLFAAEISPGRLRVFVDDDCLGETPLDDAATIQSIRCGAEAGAKLGKEHGKVWIDEVSVTWRVPVLSWPNASKDQDVVWLEHGEQLFGRIVKADSESVTLDAKFGMRNLAWAQVRGILFAQPNAITPPEPIEVTFRPCAGFPVDRLRVKLIGWKGTALKVVHPLVGELTLESERLHGVRNVAK